MLGRMKSILTVALFSTLFATACSKEPATPTPPANPPANAPANAPAKDLGNVPAAPNQTPPVVQAPPVAEKEIVTEPATPTPAAPVAVPSLADLPKLLASIKDGASANAAKAPLEALVSKLQTAKDSAAAAPASGGTASGALSGLTKIASDAAGKLGISEDVQKQIGALLEKPEVKAAIGATLEKLKGLAK